MKLALRPILRRIWPRRSSGPPGNLPAELAVPSAPMAECRLLRSIVEAADVGLIACDAAGRLVLVNPAAAALLECAPVRDGALDEWPSAVAVLRPALDRSLAEGYATAELAVERAGRPTLLEGRAGSMLSPSGRVEGAVLVLRDLTRLRELAAARADGWEHLAHDLKTPLNSIGGFTALLLQEAVGPLNPLQRDFLRTIDQEGQRLLQAVQGFLDDARSGGAERLNPVELRLPPVIEAAVDRLRSLAARKSLTIDVDVPDDLPSVNADRDRLGLVLMNLLDNALSFSRDGERIRVQAREVGGSLEISIADDGVGIPKDARELVFGRFYRAPNQPPGGRPGVGLGLAICRQIVEQHGGRIWAESGPDGGARLAFTLPVVYRQASLEALGASW